MTKSLWQQRRLGWSIVIIFACSETSVLADPTVARTIAELPRLSILGNFDEILSLLKSDMDFFQDGHVADLIQQLEQRQEHEKNRQANRRKAYESALEKLREFGAQGKTEDALSSAVEGRSISDNPDALLQDPTIQTLVAQAETQAKQAADEERWLDALTLYRALEALFDDQVRYRNHTRLATRHLRLLRLYTPETFKELYLQRAKGRTDVGDDEDAQEQAPPLNLGRETWQEKLEGITESMLRQTLQWASLKHISGRGFRPLLKGAIDAILTLLDTQGLDQTFPSLNDQRKRDLFHNYLVALRQNIDNDKRTGLDGYIDRIMEANKVTVDLPEQVIIFELADGGLSTLDDFTAVIWPREKSNFSRNTQGKFKGVGIQISSRKRRLIVVSPLLDTPAQRAGVKAGDIIAEVDHEDTSTWSLDEAVRNITGPVGTVVTLGIERVGHKNLIRIPIERAEIVIESIRGWSHTADGRWNYYIDRERRIGYVRVSQFIPQTDNDLRAAIDQMQREAPLNGLILDLRFNPGGLLPSAIEVSNRFIERGIIVTTEGPRGQETSRLTAKPHGTYPPFSAPSASGKRIVVLINEGSASASEIVAGALQDHGVAWVIGNRSFGKGSVQDLFGLDGDKAFLKLTTQYYKLPMGHIIHRTPEATEWGIEPDLVVDMTPQEITDAIQLRQELDILRDKNDPVDPADPAKAPHAAQDIIDQGIDAQLEAALLVLKSCLLAQRVALAQKGHRGIGP